MVIKKKENIEVKKLETKIITVKIRSTGTGSMLMNKMDMNVVKKYNKKKAHKIIKDDTRLEEEKTEDKIHYTKEFNVGFPASGFGKGINNVAPKLGLYKKDVRSSVRILGDIVALNYKKKDENETWGRQSGMTKAPMLIIRPEFTDWSCELKIMYDSGSISAEEIINLINLAGFHCGIGAYRPECSGTFGTYEVAV